jgi:AcrR family transcriptional regulator
VQATELPQIPTGPQLLPLADAEQCERADAARNRARILEAAQRLFEEQGVDAVSMDAIAVAAGVGKGTLFRRFGDRSGLALALLNEHESAMQEQIIRGEPPLGPGISPVERLVAFGNARFRLLETHCDLLLEAERAAAAVRYDSPVYAFYRAHMTLLIREADPELDADSLADTLLAALSADVFAYRRRIREIPLERIEAAWAQLVRKLCG